MRWWIFWLALLHALCQEALPRPVRESESVSRKRLLRRVDPVYPRDGAVRSVRVLRGHPLLIRAALRAVRQWVYRRHAPVEVITEAAVNFSLDPAVVSPNGAYH